MKTITLDEWLAQKVADLSAFRTYWAQMSYTDPDDFPREIPEGDWKSSLNSGRTRYECRFNRSSCFCRFIFNFGGVYSLYSLIFGLNYPPNNYPYFRLSPPMAEYIKNLTLKEIKEKHIDNHGFAFITPHQCSDEGIVRFVEMLRNQGISRDLPLLVSRNGNAIIFVYEFLDAPYFFGKTSNLEFMGLGKIVPLVFFLKENVKD